MSDLDFDMPCMLNLRIGEMTVLAKGKPVLLEEETGDINGSKVKRLRVAWLMKKSAPIFFMLYLPASKGLRDVMAPCNFVETFWGYKSMMTTVIAALTGLVLLNFAWGSGLIASESFFVVMPLVAGIIIGATFHQLHESRKKTYRLSVQSFDPTPVSDYAVQLVYATDCNLSLAEQLSFSSLAADLATLREVEFTTGASA